jgi:CRP/FNR family transcriptional regulator
VLARIRGKALNILNQRIAPTTVDDEIRHPQDVPVIDPSRSRCRSCALLSRCLPGGLDALKVQKFERAVSRSRLLRAGEHLFRMGDPFRSIFVVNTGSFKTCTVDAEGREHIGAFHFAGDMMGIDAIYPERHVSSSIALSNGSVCILPYPVLMSLAHEIPEVQGQILRMLSRDMLGNSSMAGDFTAEERTAAFLVMVAARQRQRDRASAHLDLAMTRQDIANYLRLAPETVSRVLARFQKSGLVKADRKHIMLLDAEGLEDLAACMNPYTRCG